MLLPVIKRCPELFKSVTSCQCPQIFLFHKRKVMWKITYRRIETSCLPLNFCITFIWDSSSSWTAFLLANRHLSCCQQIRDRQCVLSSSFPFRNRRLPWCNALLISSKHFPVVTLHAELLKREMPFPSKDCSVTMASKVCWNWNITNLLTRNYCSLLYISWECVDTRMSRKWQKLTQYILNWLVIFLPAMGLRGTHDKLVVWLRIAWKSSKREQ